ncbi:Myb-like DNA-binding domain protein [Necator americanus]|uniref:Myb-like DNA-binding domain protein n=1 Tax=Necator americanus TaxID=51031 RepID=W2T5D2_NECAM|nr:Myb-like DNA-binding domain protein [Necator americanus]ETN76391.1 Myb-like DNA-binding domain protein [Necator americanus]
MLARRSRLQVKPNISRSSKATPKPAENLDESVDVSPNAGIPAETLPVAGTSADASVNDGSAVIDGAISEESPSTVTHTLARRPRLQVKPNITESSKAAPKFTEKLGDKLKKRFTGDEELDPKKMRMMDMIYWNPKKEKGMTRFHGDTESVVGEKLSSSPEKRVTTSESTKVAAPQVKIGADGRLVIDEESLVVEETATNESVWETVEEDRILRKVTSLSFRNRMWRKGTAWTEKETELFYEILRCTGPDFGLMHEFFPTRARNELKSKFNREERTNWERLKEVMSRPALLDDDLYERAAELQREIEEEALAKKMKKETDKGTGMTFKRRKKKQEPDVDEPQEDVSVRSDQSEDLVEEASQIIREMEKEKRKRSVDSTATSPQETTEAVSVEHDCENQDEVVQSDAPESSSTPSTAAHVSILRFLLNLKSHVCWLRAYLTYCL